MKELFIVMAFGALIAVASTWISHNLEKFGADLPRWGQE